MTKRRPCGTCRGTGTVPSDDGHPEEKPCDTCDGKGYLEGDDY